MSPLTVARTARGLNQTQLAALAGTCQGQISKLERGDRTLSPEWAVRLAPHLGVQALSLLRIELQVHTNHTGRLIAEGYFERPSVTGNAPVEMVDHVLDKLFKTRGPAVPPPPPYPGPESTAPTS